MLQGSEAPPGSRSDRSGAGRPFRGAGVTLGHSSLTRRVLRRRSSRTAPALSDTTHEGMGKAGIRAAGTQTDAGQGADAFAFGAVLGRPALLLRVRAGNQVKDSFEILTQGRGGTRPPAAASTLLPSLQACPLLLRPGDGRPGTRVSQLCPGQPPPSGTGLSRAELWLSPAKTAEHITNRCCSLQEMDSNCRSYTEK